MVDIKFFFLFHNNVPEHFKGLGLNIVFNATFNNISTISGRLVLLVEETGVPGENHRPALSHRPV